MYPPSAGCKCHCKAGILGRPHILLLVASRQGNSDPAAMIKLIQAGSLPWRNCDVGWCHGSGTPAQCHDARWTTKYFLRFNAAIRWTDLEKEGENGRGPEIYRELFRRQTIV